jgi:micrococcal nuclease
MRWRQKRWMVVTGVLWGLFGLLLIAICTAPETPAPDSEPEATKTITPVAAEPTATTVAVQPTLAPTPTATLKPTPVPTPAAVPTPTPTEVTPTAASQVEAVVTNVVDGDTIDVLIDGQEYRVRYIGVDTPETVHPTRGEEPYGREASEYNKTLVGGRPCCWRRM